MIAVGAALVLGAVLLALRGEPTGGWGPNNRAWFDDEFYMDVLIQGVGWGFLVASILFSARQFYKQREHALRDRQDEIARERRRETTAEVSSTLKSMIGYLQHMRLRPGQAPAERGPVRAAITAYADAYQTALRSAPVLAHDDHKSLFENMMTVGELTSNLVFPLMQAVPDARVPMQSWLDEVDAYELAVTNYILNVLEAIAVWEDSGVSRRVPKPTRIPLSEPVYPSLTADDEQPGPA